MSGAISLTDLLRDGDAVLFLVLLGFALYKGILRFGSDCDRREEESTQHIAKLESDLEECRKDKREERERSDAAFEEIRTRYWRQRDRETG